MFFNFEKKKIYIISKVCTCTKKIESIVHSTYQVTCISTAQPLSRQVAMLFLRFAQKKCATINVKLVYISLTHSQFSLQKKKSRSRIVIVEIVLIMMLKMSSLFYYFLVICYQFAFRQQRTCPISFISRPITLISHWSKSQTKADNGLARENNIVEIEI